MWISKRDLSLTLGSITQITEVYELKYKLMRDALEERMKEIEKEARARLEENKYLSMKIDMMESGKIITEDKAAGLAARIDALECHVNEFIKSQECKWDGIDG